MTLTARFAALGLFLAAAGAQAMECREGPAAPADALQSRAILVGEVHGTVEAPEFVGRLTCQLLRQGRPVIVALEREGQEQPALDRYLRSDGKPEDVRALLATGAWARPQQDGRSSQAMLALIEQVRQWRRAGERVGLLAMQLEFHEIVQLPESEKHPLSGTDLDRLSEINDRTMADKAWMTLALYPGHTLVALAGNVHTALGSRARAGFITTPSFADVLASYTPVHVIGLKSQGGSSWNMSSSGSGPRTVIAGPLYLQDARVDSQVDIGKISASPPAALP